MPFKAKQIEKLKETERSWIVLDLTSITVLPHDGFFTEKEAKRTAKERNDVEKFINRIGA